MFKSFSFPGLFDCFSLRLEMAMRTKHFNFLPVLKIILTILSSFSHSDLGRSNLLSKSPGDEKAFDYFTNVWSNQVNIIFGTGRKLKCFAPSTISGIKEK